MQSDLTVYFFLFCKVVELLSCIFYLAFGQNGSANIFFAAVSFWPLVDPTMTTSTSESPGNVKMVHCWQV